jgi:hypothetical protein
VAVPQFERFYQLLIDKSTGHAPRGVDLEVVDQI